MMMMNSLPHTFESITDSCTEIICMNIGVSLSQYYHMMCIDVLLNYIRQCLTQSAQNVRQCTFYSSPGILNIQRLNVYTCICMMFVVVQSTEVLLVWH